MNKINVAVVGLGLVGLQRLKALLFLRKIAKKTSLIISAYDPDKNKLKDIKNLKNVKFFSKFSDLLFKKNDLVIICTPHNVTKKLSLIFLKKGSNLLVEKPFGISSKEAKQLVSFRKRRQKIHVGFNYRFFKSINLLINDIRLNKFGKIISVNLISGHGHSPSMKKSWKLNPRIIGGGSLLDPGVHLLDLILQIAASSKIKIIGGSKWRGFWNKNLDEEVHLLLSDKKNTIFNLQTSIVRWKSSFRIEVNGTKAYGIVYGRGRSYGRQNYIFAKKWAWLTLGKQAKGEKYIVKNDNCDDSFLIETALALGKKYFEMHKLRKFIYGVNCDHSHAIQVMDLYDKCKKYLENKYL